MPEIFEEFKKLVAVLAILILVIINLEAGVNTRTVRLK